MYVACSRVKNIRGLHILNFNLAAIKKSVKVEAEMERLANKLVKPIQMPIFTDLPSGHDRHLLTTICSLNVRSIVNKVDDVRCDSFLQSVDILCVCETWLTTSHRTPILIDGHNVIRSDRANANNIRGGGLMISCKHNVTYLPIHVDLANNGVETISGTFVLCDIPIILSLMYRPPQVPIRNLFDTINDVIKSVNEHEPMIVLGDFNEDIMNGDNSLVQFMNSNGFRQYVCNATTDGGTMIDLIFARNLESIVYTVDTYDVYYSDHDVVYCKLNFNE